MRLVIQRVTQASVRVKGELVGEIGKGFLVLLGIGEEDNEDTAKRLAQKLARLRIFPDEEDRTNLTLADVGGEVLVISQFTLYADCKKNRPSFSHAAKPDVAEPLYESFLAYLTPLVNHVEKGVFGAMMEVSLINDGPFTVLLEG